MYTLGKVTLTRLREDQIEMVRNWRNNPKVYMQLVTRKEVTPEQQKAWFASLDPVKDHYFIANRKGQPFGLVYARHYDGNQAETGIFVSSDAMGLPYGLVAAYALIRYCFEELNCKKLVASHYPTNTNVMKSDEWFGYRITHTEVKAVARGNGCSGTDESNDLIWSELLRETYESNHEAIIKALERL